MRRADKRTLAACVLALAAAAVLPFAAHPAWTLAVLFLTPVLAECLRACGMKGQGMAIAAVMCLCAWLAGHPQQVSQLACLWCLAAMLTDRLFSHLPST